MAFLSRLGIGGGNYAYVAARVRVKKAKLLPADEYARLLARDANEIARALQEGAYKGDIDALPRWPGVLASPRLRDGRARVHDRLLPRALRRAEHQDDPPREVRARASR